MTIARQVAGGVQTASAQDAALDLLARHPEGLTVTEIAEHLRLHVTTVRVHLNRLVAEERLLQRDERVGVGRPRRRRNRQSHWHAAPPPPSAPWCRRWRN